MSDERLRRGAGSDCVAERVGARRGLRLQQKLARCGGVEGTVVEAVVLQEPHGATDLATGLDTEQFSNLQAVEGNRVVPQILDRRQSLVRRPERRHHLTAKGRRQLERLGLPRRNPEHPAANQWPRRR